MFIRIDTSNKLKIETSLHKQYEKSLTGRFTNYGNLSLDQAKRASDAMLDDKEFDTSKLMVYAYEIGVNLYVSKDCREYLDKILSIGILEDKKEFFVNPKYKDRRMKTTVFHHQLRKYFKIYDKVFEAKDKRRGDSPEGANILRLEIVHRRVSGMSYDQFFSPENLVKICDRFFRDFRTVQFAQCVKVPKGAGRSKQELCKKIIELTPEIVLQQAKESHKTGALSDKAYRNIREFIARDWDNFKTQISIIQTPEEIEFRTLLKTKPSG